MILELRDVSRAFGTLQVLDSVSLEIPPGSVTAIVGTNGAGKSTLLRLMGGALRPTRGEIRYDGEVLTRARLDLRRRVMFLADTPMVLRESPLVTWIGTCLRVYGVERPGLEAMVSRVLDDLDLGSLAGMPLATLSRGQLYKAALAALIAVDPELWLLDEPFASGIDPAALAVLSDAVRMAASRGRTVVLATQMLDLAGRIVDRAVLVRDGGVAAHGPVQELAVNGEGLEEMFKSLWRKRG